MNNTVSVSVLTELALLINFPFKSLSILGPHVGTATTFWFVLEVESLLSICLLLIWESGIFSLYYIKKNNHRKMLDKFDVGPKTHAQSKEVPGSAISWCCCPGMGKGTHLQPGMLQYWTLQAAGQGDRNGPYIQPAELLMKPGPCSIATCSWFFWTVFTKAEQK